MSAIIGGLIPKIEGFQPIPNAVMIPFMEVQSAALAYGFGLNYEFSKRKIRSMSNEEYNKLTPQDIEEMQARHTAVLLEGFIKRVPQVMPAQAQIFTQYVEIEKLKVKQNFELAKWMVQFAKEFIDDETAHLLGGHIHPAGSTSPTQQTQTYFDPNNPSKDFVPNKQPTSDFPPSGQPKTNITVPNPESLVLTINLMVNSNRPAGDNVTLNKAGWIARAKQERVNLNALASKPKDQRNNQWIKWTHENIVKIQRYANAKWKMFF